MTDFHIQLETHERPEIGPAASLNDLALPLAHVLQIADRQGARRPAYTIHASEDGQRREVTEVERTEFVAALERTLDQLGAS